jgi:hypothetical protein
MVWSDVPMQLDTGADISLVPQEVITQLELTVDPHTAYELASFDGHTSLAPMARLEFVFCQRTLWIISCSFRPLHAR